MTQFFKVRCHAEELEALAGRPHVGLLFGAVERDGILSHTLSLPPTLYDERTGMISEWVIEWMSSVLLMSSPTTERGFVHRLIRRSKLATRRPHSSPWHGFISHRHADSHYFGPLNLHQTRCYSGIYKLPSRKNRSTTRHIFLKKIQNFLTSHFFILYLPHQIGRHYRFNRQMKAKQSQTHPTSRTSCRMIAFMRVCCCCCCQWASPLNFIIVTI